MKVTAYKSDISGAFIAEEKELARIRVTFPNDKRRPVRVIDATEYEVEKLLGTYGQTMRSPGRKPAAESS